MQCIIITMHYYSNKNKINLSLCHYIYTSATINAFRQTVIMATPPIFRSSLE